MIAVREFLEILKSKGIPFNSMINRREPIDLKTQLRNNNSSGTPLRLQKRETELLLIMDFFFLYLFFFLRDLIFFSLF